MSKHKVAKLALEINKGERGCVVTAARARWKERHSTIRDEAVLRLVRFVWMRHPFPREQTLGLHAGLLGKAMRSGLLEYEGGALRATSLGKTLLEEDRK